MSDPQNLIDRFNHATGKLVAWLTFIMVVVTCIIVVMRYVFDAGLIWLQESVIWMHATVFMSVQRTPCCTKIMYVSTSFTAK